MESAYVLRGDLEPGFGRFVHEALPDVCRGGPCDGVDVQVSIGTAHIARTPPQDTHLTPSFLPYAQLQCGQWRTVVRKRLALKDGRAVNGVSTAT